MLCRNRTLEIMYYFEISKIAVIKNTILSYQKKDSRETLLTSHKMPWAILNTVQCSWKVFKYTREQILFTER